MQRLADVEEEENDPIAFLEALKLDLGQDEVYVFTPKGRVIALVEGATTIDFAYAVHTEVGHHCVGARSTVASCPSIRSCARPTWSRS